MPELSRMPLTVGEAEMVLALEFLGKLAFSLEIHRQQLFADAMCPKLFDINLCEINYDWTYLIYIFDLLFFTALVGT